MILRLVFLALLAHSEIKLIATDTPSAESCTFERKKEVEAIAKEYPSAGKECIEAFTKAEECCLDPAQEECGYIPSSYGNDPTLPKEGAYGNAVQQAHKSLMDANKNFIFSAISAGAIEKAVQVCKKNSQGEGYRFRDFVSEHLHRFSYCMKAQAQASLKNANGSLPTINAATGDAKWIIAGHYTSVNGASTQQHALVNSGSSQGQFVSGDARDELEVKSVAIKSRTIGQCSGAVDENGSLQTASHCDSEDFSSVLKDSSGDYKIGSWDRSGELKYDDRNSITGARSPDSAVHAPDVNNPDEFKGRSYYRLTEDTALSSGCEVRDNILACSRSALSSMQGTVAEIQGYPVEWFKKGKAPLNDAQTVLVTRGNSFFDPYSSRMNVQAYASSGSSGGPVYYPSGTELGGVVADRPIMIGSTSTASTDNGSGAIVLNPVTTGVSVLSYNEARGIMIPRVDDETLKIGGNIFPGAPGSAR